jgi:predicted DNA-binding ribbon-helix-helix protein
MNSFFFQDIKSATVKRSVVIDGHPTSVSLEIEFWEALKEIADARNTTVPKLISAIGRERQGATNLCSAIRLYVLNYYAGRLVERQQTLG